MRGRQEGQSQRIHDNGSSDWRGEKIILLALKMEEGPPAKECSGL